MPLSFTLIIFKMRHKLGLAAAFILASFQLQAQNDADYLRYSILNYGSTSRSLGMGNSFGALGADISTLSTNPAGIGLYHRSEMTITPAFLNRNTENDFEGNIKEDNYFQFAIGNFGLVFADKRKNKNWKYLNFGIGYNRTKNFGADEFSQYNNRSNTLIDSWVEELNTTGSLHSDYPYEQELAWWTYLINYDTTTNQYTSGIPNGGTRQTQTIERRGGQGEWDFSISSNYRDKLYLGFTLGVAIIRYEENMRWTEEDVRDTIDNFKYYEYSTGLITSGSGFNLKFGAIYKFSSFLRAGFAIHTPTWLYLTDDYRSSITSDMEAIQNFSVSGPDFLPFDYRIESPFRMITSLAIIAGKAGAINVDYEVLDYSMGHVKPRDAQFNSAFSETNQAINVKYGWQHNIRVGVELPIDALRVRFGGEYTSSPFDKNLRPDNTDLDMSGYTFTGGLGYRAERFYLDAAYAWSRFGSFNYPYTMDFESTPGITSTRTDNRFQFTFGWLF